MCTRERTEGECRTPFERLPTAEGGNALDTRHRSEACVLYVHDVTVILRYFFRERKDILSRRIPTRVIPRAYSPGDEWINASDSVSLGDTRSRSRGEVKRHRLATAGTGKLVFRAFFSRIRAFSKQNPLNSLICMYMYMYARRRRIGSHRPVASSNVSPISNGGENNVFSVLRHTNTHVHRHTLFALL